LNVTYPRPNVSKSLPCVMGVATSAIAAANGSKNCSAGSIAVRGKPQHDCSQPQIARGNARSAGSGTRRSQRFLTQIRIRLPRCRALSARPCSVSPAMNSTERVFVSPMKCATFSVGQPATTGASSPSVSLFCSLPKTGDAWLLDPSDQLAAPFADDFRAQSVSGGPARSDSGAGSRSR
jgi:hypothetical protein